MFGPLPAGTTGCIPAAVLGSITAEPFQLAASIHVERHDQEGGLIMTGLQSADEN